MDIAAAASERYLVERVMTASPAELTAMLYDAAVGALRSAQRLQGEQQHLAALPRIQKAQDIVLELRSTLNHDAGDLAAHLDALYTWCWTRLLDASTARGGTGIADALEVLAPLQEAWRASCCTLAAQAS
jgi:flagellar secretion chaperone FliS